SIPVVFVFIHSGVDAKVADPLLQFQQSQARRVQLLARSEIAASVRAVAGDKFNLLVKQAKEGKVSAARLASHCREVVATDDAWIAALGTLAAEEQAQVAAVTALKEKDAATWGGALDGVTRQATETKEELE